MLYQITSSQQGDANINDNGKLRQVWCKDAVCIMVIFSNASI